MTPSTQHPSPQETNSGLREAAASKSTEGASGLLPSATRDAAAVCSTPDGGEEGSQGAAATSPSPQVEVQDCSGTGKQSPAEPQGDVVEKAKAAAKSVPPTCNVCGVEYVEEYEGQCQEPRPPYKDPSRTCPGRVAVHPEKIAEAVIAAITPLLPGSPYALVRERLAEHIEKHQKAESLASSQGVDSLAEQHRAAKEALMRVRAALTKEDSDV